MKFKKQRTRRGKRDKAREKEAGNRSQAVRTALINHPNKEDAISRVRTYAGNLQDGIIGGEISDLSLDLAHIIYLQDWTKKQLDKLQDRLSKTDPVVKVQEKNEGVLHGIKGFLKWKGKDQILFLTSLVLMPLTLGAGGACIFVNATSSGIQAYLDRPWLALFLTILPIGGSFIPKPVRDYLPTDSAKKTFTFIWHALALVFLSAWVFLFAQIFDGSISQVFDPSMLESESDGKETLFIAIQIFTEMFVSGIFYMMINDIHAQYTPGSVLDKEEYRIVEEKVKKKNVEYESLLEQRREIENWLTELKAGREAFIQEEEALYLNQRHQWEASVPNLA